MSAVIYRVLDTTGERQYLRRCASPELFLWHADKALAIVLETEKARLLAAALRGRSLGYYGRLPTQPAGTYAIEEVAE